MNDKTCWVDTLEYRAADASLRAAYDAVRGPSGSIDNLYRAFSLMPHAIRPADELYRAALHHEANRLPQRFSELLGSYVALLTGCDYALAHHGHNYAHLLGDRARARSVLDALRADRLDECGDAREVAALRHARKLCLEPAAVERSDHERLVAAGYRDAEIVEIVQVVAMFSYFVRVINGLGISLAGERIGLY